ncbi:MAG: hypothetical protein CMF49_05950 [Legionellales bacterium]|nr:hypothetical protein [Legionellales bacterium]|tara:strand:+ start:1311 stop:2015 length:705 start_codon:yes stop_codon:yes gene_type:complete
MDKTILCYGDSNTWGYVPQVYSKEFQLKRYPFNIRWPGRLQQMLGSKYHVIEEGLNGRTTNLDYPIPPDRNGKTHLPACLYTHAPIDLVILALGGNDMKIQYNRNATEIFNALLELVHLIKSTNYGVNFNIPPKILVLSPLLPLSIGEQFTDEQGNFVFTGAKTKAKELVTLLDDNDNATDNFHFLNIANNVCLSEIDGLHLNVNGHKLLAEIIYTEIIKIFDTRTTDEQGSKR